MPGALHKLVCVGLAGSADFLFFKIVCGFSPEIVPQSLNGANSALPEHHRGREGLVRDGDGGRRRLAASDRLGRLTGSIFAGGSMLFPARTDASTCS